MFLVDFEKLGNIQSLEIDKEEKRSVFDILDSLSYKSENDQIKERSLPAYTIDLSNEIDKLLQEKLIVECLGKKRNLSCNIYFSSIYKSPEIYHNAYFKAMQIIEQGEKNARTYFWLEDSILFFSTKEVADRKVIDEYEKIIIENGAHCDTLLCSQVINSAGIPYTFADKYLRNVLLEDILQTIPFHKRVLPKVLLIDILHFCWNLYEIYLFPGIYLAGINSKRNFEIFRRILNDKQIAILFFPII